MIVFCYNLIFLYYIDNTLIQCVMVNKVLKTRAFNNFQLQTYALHVFTFKVKTRKNRSGIGNPH